MRRRWQVNWDVVQFVAITWALFGWLPVVIQQHHGVPIWAVIAWLGPFGVAAPPAAILLLRAWVRSDAILLLRAWVRSDGGWLVRRTTGPVITDLRKARR